MEAFTFFSIIVSSLILYACWAFIASKPAKNLPPGPPKLPIIGNMHQLDKIAPHRALRALSRKYGPIFHLKLGQVSTVVVCSPQLAQEVLKTQDLTFSDRPSMTTSELFFYGRKNIAWSDYGNYWRQMKKMCTLELLSVKKSRDPIQKMVNDIVSRATLGDVCKDRDELLDRAGAMLRTFNSFNIENYFPRLTILNAVTGRKATWLKMQKQLDVILERLLEDHRSRPTEDHEDLVDVLLRVQKNDDLDLPIADDNIKAIILEMLTAGTTSSSMTVEWAITEMMRKPEIMKKAQAEVRAVVKGERATEAEIQKLNYTRLVIKETLRLHSLPLMIPHECREDCVVNGYDIPAKTKLIVNLFACSTDPDTWEDPDTFKPERFTDTTISSTGADFKYFPFGAGRRICPGMNFAIGSVEYILTNLLLRYDWKLPDGMKPHDIDMRDTTALSTLPLNPMKIIPVPLAKFK
ncbi:hypothetical protein E3N88_36883 [Mikania micrantha]|uniref:Cytochrome P450 n=1 Tax=Mikania micrantha TaxID=192012 RepID=A0A5N6M7P0_9ASTR|nr:hypothetical protein E3N88_36883 [Mikania micrantha]